MPANRTKASGSGLGKALINRRAREAVAPKESQLYTLDESNPLQSVTHERDLDEFLANAALADADFTTERSKMRIISAPGETAKKNPYLLSADEEREVAKKKVDLQYDLRVPRRPPWTRQTTRQELERQERDSFLDWRRDLAQLAESSNLLLTPFERNIQLWRQLWRVLERSHLIVQIVDARNPLGFRCVDLEAYVHETGSDEEDAAVPGKGKRRSLLLINKADLLTKEQRSAWADYFEKEGVAYAFFSAADAAAAQEQADKQRRRAEDLGEYESDEEDEERDGEGVGEDEEVEISGEEVEPEDEDDDEDEEEEADEDDAELSKAVAQTKLDGDDEEGWSTEGEEEDAEAVEEGDEVAAKLQSGQAVPLKEVAQDVTARAVREEKEDIRTRVLTVVELEDLFLNAAPDLNEFATARQPSPSKLVVGLVGYPNVGKSSTINALLGAKKVSVSSTPGKTKHFQTLVLSDEVTLCDCPGLVFPQFANTQADMVVDGVLPIDQMREYSAPVDLLCRRVPREILEGTYGIRIDVREIEDGGTGLVGWEELLSTYAIARGMTRSSFGMPDTSRAARYILKDYVNARLLFAHPPPGVDADEFMKSSRDQTLERLEEEFRNGRKRAPVTHVGKNADTFVAPAGSSDAGLSAAPSTQAGAQAGTQGYERQSTSRQVRASAASAPARSGREKSAAMDNVFFMEAGPAPRPVVKGRNQAQDEQDGGLGFARPMMYPHQRMLGPDGRPLYTPQSMRAGGGGAGRDKKHFKVKEGKKRSGRGYD
ncbi:hypothetical protein EHS25_004442 [Saitozyma podzolica]|uniref:G domain-containing protein n=1 Tax=Saitozyma podzolica TaxID=1890683 RepID=A0A427YU32_9TREE|nr:hypothetical protein EHS25_004442 [Saitozyma podzolica]